MNILFVCTGNTCRSPMAEAIVKGMIKGQPDKYRHLKVASAGTLAVPGIVASSHAIQAVRENGQLLEGFVSQPLTKELVDAADFIFTMTNGHYQQVVEISQESREKVFLLKAFSENFSLSEGIAAIAQGYGKLQEEKHRFIEENKARIADLEKLRVVDELQYRRDLRQLEDEMHMYTTQAQRNLFALQQKMKNLEIIDPYGGSLDIYRQCYAQLDGILKVVIDRLVEVN